MKELKEKEQHKQIESVLYKRNPLSVYVFVYKDFIYMQVKYPIRADGKQQTARDKR